MTTPVPVTGHADWQTGIPWRSLNLFSDLSHVYPVGLTNTPVFTSAGFASLLLRFTPTNGGGKLTVTWYDDAAGATSIGTDTWNLTSSTWLLTYIPVEGLFLRITFNNTTAGTVTAGNHASLTQVTASQAKYPVIGSWAGQIGASIAASASLFDSPLFITKGHGHLRLNPGDALGKLNASLYITDEMGTHLANLYVNNGFTAEADFDFPYPDVRVRLQIQNTDAGAAHTVDYTLWCDSA